ncbi:MAG: SDR family NAD(P)-dependent oxidoreductase [Frankiales bacterium]|nr:SDR family NAD(P)-dependent oxidoreductase [Frankiales bacterium]
MVTGGGRGIGRACALALSEADASVIVTTRTRSEVEDVAAELRAGGGRALAVVADVADYDCQVPGLMERGSPAEQVAGREWKLDGWSRIRRAVRGRSVRAVVGG